jgi:hypothetical protein
MSACIKTGSAARLFFAAALGLFCAALSFAGNGDKGAAGGKDSAAAAAAAPAEKPEDAVKRLSGEAENLNKQITDMTSEKDGLEQKKAALEKDLRKASTWRLSFATFLSTAAIAVVLLAGAALFFILHYRGMKKRGEYAAAIAEALNALQSRHEEARDFPRPSAAAFSSPAAEPDRGAEALRSAEQNASRINALERRLVSLETELEDQKARLKREQQDRESIKSGASDPVSVFNRWAANPVTPLPAAFSYLKGDMKIRTNQSIVETAAESKWIYNRDGAKKYLFPNPKFFDQMTDISELYKMDQSLLKAKGQNKIHVGTPCEITGNGYINYPGDLTLL